MSRTQFKQNRPAQKSVLKSLIKNHKRNIGRKLTSDEMRRLCFNFKEAIKSI